MTMMSKAKLQDGVGGLVGVFVMAFVARWGWELGWRLYHLVFR